MRKIESIIIWRVITGVNGTWCQCWDRYNDFSIAEKRLLEDANYYSNHEMVISPFMPID